MLVKAIDSLFPVGKPVGGKRWLNFLWEIERSWFYSLSAPMAEYHIPGGTQGYPWMARIPSWIKLAFISAGSLYEMFVSRLILIFRAAFCRAVSRFWWLRFVTIRGRGCLQLNCWQIIARLGWAPRIGVSFIFCKEYRMRTASIRIVMTNGPMLLKY
jgi:hypothetical protein